jgi:anti-sigma regulatory factor (Ser/Thr protein kinase)
MPDSASEPCLRLELLSQARLLVAVRALISALAQRAGFTEHQAGQISLAVDEALCNVINHGYQKRPDGRIWISVWLPNGGEEDEQWLRVVIDDRAHEVDPRNIRSRDLDDVRPGGLGVYIIRQIMDDVRYERREGGGMRLTMSKRVPAPPVPTIPPRAEGATQEGRNHA